ncbi:MAG: DNA-protecting protein DprA [Quinella sp. 3Q1]|nr:DNA-protecting protein DprA [Quinella sp. 3Q1]
MDKYYMAAMGGAEGLGNKSIARLVKFFGSAKAAWFAEAGELFQTSVKKSRLGALIEFRVKYPNAPENLVRYCERHKFGLCSIADEDYPPLLKEIDSPPMFFYYRGKLQPHVQRIGIVGSRHNTPYGQNVALELGEQLAAAGLTVVSGAARGIDSFAHRGALKTGRTVAVLGCGIEIAFRGKKEKFFEQIAERGVVLSEFPPQFPPSAGTFPPRNRIIAGLCKGVIIVEAGQRSGALITSTYAGNYGRDVFAIPGQIYAEMSRGCNELIRDGATLIKNAQDVLNEYNLTVAIKPTQKIDSTTPVKPIELDDTAAKVLEVIPFDRFITDDEILDKLEEIAPNELPGIILELEIKGCVTEDAGRYKRKVGG